MAEAIAEMVLPGTYIEVRAEGLISVGAIVTGNIGIVGTAARGPRNEVRAIGSYAEALDLFGPYDAFTAPTVADNPLTLARALEQAFGGGAQNVFAVRIAERRPRRGERGRQRVDGQQGRLHAHRRRPRLVGERHRRTRRQRGHRPPHRLEADARSTATSGRCSPERPSAQVHAALADSTLVTVGDAASNAGTRLRRPSTRRTTLAGGTDDPERLLGATSRRA